MSAIATDELMGPIDYAVVEFPIDETRPAPTLAFELTALVDAELIRVLDLVIVSRRVDGGVDVTEYEDLPDRAGLPVLEGRLAEVLSATDVRQAASTLAPGATGLVIVFENTWAAPLTEAARAGRDRLVAGGRIATADLVAALATLPQED